MDFQSAQGKCMVYVEGTSEIPNYIRRNEMKRMGTAALTTDGDMVAP